MSAFWKDAVERASKSAAAAVLLVVGKAQLASGLEILDARLVDWPAVGGAAAGMAFLSLVMSVASRQVGDDESASLVKP